jgi:hypothetical protein
MLLVLVYLSDGWLERRDRYGWRQLTTAGKILQLDLEWLVIGLWLAICIIPIITSWEISGFCDTVAASPEHCTRQAISYRQRRARELCVCVCWRTRDTYVLEIMRPAHVLLLHCHLTKDTNVCLALKKAEMAYVSFYASAGNSYSFKASINCLLLKTQVWFE